MPRIRCYYIDCIFIDEGYCSAAAVELDPDTGCATYAPSKDDMNNWEEDDLEDWESEGDGEADDDADLWLEDEDDL